MPEVESQNFPQISPFVFTFLKKLNFVYKGEYLIHNIHKVVKKVNFEPFIISSILVLIIERKPRVFDNAWG